MKYKGKILGVAYGGGHANCVLPVLEELQNRGYEVQFLALTSAIPQVKKTKIPFKTFRDYLHLIDEKAAYQLGVAEADKNHNPNLGIEFEETVYYLGMDRLENQLAYGAEVANHLYEKVGRQAFLPVEFIKSIMCEEKPDVVITTNSPKSEKAAQIAANQLNIKSIRIEDLYGLPGTPYFQTRAEVGKELYDKTLGRILFRPTLISVVCKMTSDVLMNTCGQWGMDSLNARSIVVTGQPAFEKTDAVMMANKRVDLFTDKTQPVITWAHQNVTPDGNEVLALLRDWRNNYSTGINLVIKVHPNMTPMQVEALISNFDNTAGEIKIVHRELDPDLLIWSSDIVMAQNSTMLTQAAYMGRPVIVLDPIGRQLKNPMVMSKIAPIAKNAMELSYFIKHLLDQESELFKNFMLSKNNVGYVKNGVNNIADMTALLLGNK